MGSQPVDWTSSMVQAFEDCKSSLSRATLVAHPHPSVALALFTDDSDTSNGAALQQRVCDAWQPLAFYTHKLSPTQQKYSPYDREILAVYEAISTSDIWSKLVTLLFIRITSLSLMFSSNGEINARHDNSVIWSLLANSLPTSGMSQVKTMLWQTPYRERTPSRRLLISLLLRVSKIRMRSYKTFFKMVPRFDWNQCTFPGRTSISTATRLIHNRGHL